MIPCVRAGELQSLAWLALATGGLVGNLMGGFALQRMDTTTMFTIFMMLVGAQLLVCSTTREMAFGLGKLHQQQEKAVMLPQKTKRIWRNNRVQTR
jgi:predicted MFS family arabinose efflux permease